MDINVFLIVCPLVFLAGLVDSIAGGGGLIALPAYLMAGLPPQLALGTNKLSSIGGTTIASIRYYKNKYVDLMTCLPSIAAALIGSALGSSLALYVNEKVIQWILLMVIPVTAFYIFRKKEMDSVSSGYSRKKTIILSVIISFFIGGYDGFSGPGTGTFLILLYNGAAKIDARISAGNAKLVNFSSNLSALILFLINGKVLIPLGIAASFFNMLGGYIGSGLVIHKGTKIIRYTILIILTLIFIKLIWDMVLKQV
ncbi:MAG: TSUP family transporter [Treponema sp.]|nr:TSUP family transporter [Treponema sp.]